MYLIRSKYSKCTYTIFPSSFPPPSGYQKLILFPTYVVQPKTSICLYTANFKSLAQKELEVQREQ